MRERARAPYTLLATSVTAFVATACSAGDLPRSVLIARLPSDEHHVHLGSAPVGDIDGDGAADVALVCSAQAWDRAELIAEIINPRTRARIFELRTGVIAGWGGGDCAAGGDANGDGWPDVLLMLPERVDGGSSRVWLYSGRDARLLQAWENANADESFGRYAGTVGDLDGDGADDVWVGAPQVRMGAPTAREPAGEVRASGAGFVRVYSGRSGAELLTATGELAGDALGERVVPLGDLDGDGVRELAIGTSYESTRPCAFVVSGRDGTRLRTLVPPLADPKDDLHLVGAYDSNGDGALECMLWEREVSWLVSPRDGTVVGRFAHERWYPSLVGDLDRDGTSDFVVCDMETRGSDPFETGGLLATLYSGRDGRAPGERFFGEMGMPPTIAPLGDIDGDRVPDLLLTYPTNVVVSGAPMFGLRP